MDNVDFISSNVPSSHQEALLYVFEDNEAVIKMIIKGRSLTMRLVSRTHRVALDWLFDRINLDPKIQIKYIDTKNHLADILTKGNFTRDEWNHFLCLFNISHFSSINSLEAMSKRTQEDAGEERVTAKSKPMMNLVSRYRVRDPNVLASTASESPMNTKSDIQNVPLSSLNVQQTSTGRPVLGEIKICTDVGFLKTVEVGQYFMTKHTDEFLQFAEPVTCREYTLPRDEKSTDPKGWIRGNTKIGPVLEVTTSYLQGKYGVENRIESVNKDNSHSWVRISRGLNKLVTDLIDKEYDDNEQETSEVEDGNI